MMNNKVIFTIAAGVIALGLVWFELIRRVVGVRPSSAPPSPQTSIPLLAREGVLWVRAAPSCEIDTQYQLMIDTGSGALLVDGDKPTTCGTIRLSGAQEQKFASETAITYSTIDPLPISLVGGQQSVNLNSRVFFANSGFSVLGLWHGNQVGIDSFSITYEGSGGSGYLDIPAARTRAASARSITVPYQIIVEGFYVIDASVNGKPMKMILDSGSSDMFVSPNTIDPNTASLEIILNNGAFTLQRAAAPVSKTLGGQEFIAMLDKYNALLAGLPVFSGYTVSFDTQSQTVSFDQIVPF